MNTTAHTVPVTTALKNCLDQLNIAYNDSWIFSDTRKPKGFVKAVGVKFSGLSLSESDRQAVRDLMEKQGYIFIANSDTGDYEKAPVSRAARFGSYRSPWRGVRLTYAQPQFKFR